MKKMMLSVLFLSVLALPAFAQMIGGPMKGEPGCCQMMGMGGMDKMGDMMGMCLANAEKIGLSDEQLKKIKSIHRDMQKKQAQFKADMKIAEIDMMDIMDVKDFDLEKATTAAKKMDDMRTAHHLEMLKAMKEVRAVLTEDQFKKMRKLMYEKMGAKKPMKKMMKP